ncbi:BatD family protein [Shewanella atlantica]|uniref:Protein BatD n=1 Tax=Shewanella atlantica TaxID=271099 RepID=A0A431WFJ5_9GAMM|nr:BatD family protein [Shewanella atlantica]RTR34263.1 protein BatD [Shewanella atlantica]
MVIRQLFIAALLTLSFSFPSFAISKIETSVDRNPAVEGEYLVLTINADDDISTGKLDTSALLHDFIVGRTSVSRSTQIVNFDSKKLTRWQVLLAPKRSGNILIPPFTIDGVSSEPISLSVVPAGSQTQQMQSLFVRTSLSTEEAYVGQLITYKVKLFLAVDLQRGVLSAPAIDGAQIKQLGEDVDTTEIVNGRRYRVIERTYGIIADQPGELTIEGANFSGDVVVQSSRRGGMFSFNESKPMQAKATKSIILINPIPVEFVGDWLVSDLVALNEDWTQEDSYELGSPITRTITLLAVNTDETSLPELDIKVPSELKTYPEKAQRQSFVRDKKIVSQLTQTLAIVPTKAGSYTLPEISVPWWNPHTKQQEVAKLPARTIVIIGSDNVENELPLISAETHGSTSSGIWPWSTLFFALLWLVTLLLWRRALSHNSPAGNERLPASTVQPKQSSSYERIVQACEEENAGKALSSLQTYFCEQYAQTMTLNEISQLSPALHSVIAALQASAFSREKTNLDYRTVLASVKSAPTISTKPESSPLVELNPR